MEKHSFTVLRTAHYCSIGQPTGETRRFIFACHGYGQLAEHFIRRFDALDDGRTIIIAPEGLSRFYTESMTGGKVGASWMTKLDRLEEIADYARFLQDLFTHYQRQLAPETQIFLLGFSQGCATIIRWIMAGHFPAHHHLVLWGGLTPEDLDYIPHTTYWERHPVHLVYGRQDRFLTPERIDWQRQFAVAQGLALQEHPYEGGHQIDREVLKHITTALEQSGDTPIKGV